MCYHIKKKQEVTAMEENLNPSEEQEQTAPEAGYKPRPKWQVWTARIALVLFLILLAMYYLRIAKG